MQRRNNQKNTKRLLPTPDNYNISEEQLLATLLPYGTVCVESALFYYGYSDFAPREWSIAVPRTYRNQISNIQEVPIKAYYVQKNIIELGKTIGDFNGVTLLFTTVKGLFATASSIVQSLIVKHLIKHLMHMFQTIKRIF